MAAPASRPGEKRSGATMSVRMADASCSSGDGGKWYTSELSPLTSAPPPLMPLLLPPARELLSGASVKPAADAEPCTELADGVVTRLNRPCWSCRYTGNPVHWREGAAGVR